MPGLFIYPIKMIELGYGFILYINYCLFFNISRGGPKGYKVGGVSIGFWFAELFA